MLNWHFCKKGYARVNIKDDCGIKICRLVHRVVAIEHLPNPLNLPQINHKDGNKLNNAVENLEWCTCMDNVKHSVETGLVKRGKERPNSKLSDEEVLQMRQLRKLGYTYYELGSMFGLSYQSAHRVCAKITYSHI